MVFVILLVTSLALGADCAKLSSADAALSFASQLGSGFGIVSKGFSSKNQTINAGKNPDRAFSNFTKLFVVGGFDGHSLDRVEVVDLENLSNNTYNITPYPDRSYGMTAGVIQNIVKVCGGVLNRKACYDYHAVNKTWCTSTPMLYERYHHAASFIEDFWLLSGSSGSTGGYKTTEIWTGSAFEEGPQLLRGLRGHCQLTINSTHVFFAKGDMKPNYLLDWTTRKWTILAPTIFHIANASCGLINSDRNGREVVLAGYEKSEIFNFDKLAWRNGPHAPYFYGAGSTQLFDTFVVVGGRNLKTMYSGFIHKFDTGMYDWTTLEQRLQVPARALGVVTIPTKIASFEEAFPDLAFNNYTKLVVIGGWNEGPLNRTEIFDLENETRICNQISDYPMEQTGMAVGVFQGLIKSCGGQSSPHNACYDYDPNNDTWFNSTSMLSDRYYHGASFIESVWLLSNGGPNKQRSTMEMWNGRAFEPSFYLPRKMFGHCQLTVDSAHVFFADPDGKANYLLNWAYETWTELPPMATRMREHSCGLVNNPTMGREAVVVGFGKVEIFNFKSHTWRFGRDATYFYTAGYAQLSDTFVVVGGYGRYGYHEVLDTIYKFDNIDYEWIPLSQRLQTPSAWYPGVVAVPDTFVNCT